VIALDNRGAGQSDKPDRPMSTQLLAEDALAVIRDTGETSAHWVGISLGGMILQQLALTQPKVVRSLVLIATHCGGEQRASRLSPEQDKRIAQSPHRRLSHLYSIDSLLRRPELIAEDATHFGKMPLHAIIRQDQAVRSHDTCGRLKEIDAPVLIIHGREDRLVPVARGRQLEQALPHARLEILEGGHQVHSEQFEKVTNSILAFVEEVEGQPAHQRT
jgi:3-oxoadipate enol-lactonase